MTLPPRVGINAIFLEPRMGGIETYLRALVPELARFTREATRGTLDSCARAWKARA